MNRSPKNGWLHIFIRLINNNAGSSQQQSSANYIKLCISPAAGAADRSPILQMVSQKLERKTVKESH